MMFNNTLISTCPSFQPNSVATQHSAGFNALFAEVTLRPSFVYLMAKLIAYQGQGSNRFQLIETRLGIGQQLNLMPEQQLSWFTDTNVFNKINKGKHYSRPDGLPPSPPPKQRRRCEKEGGVAKS